ncbi:hypothetical protein DL546_001292 [Coniochaeta pulveracea]|uniref:Uncharacterized protein n=1 Tax=Coniochaeta pulveracea TaxID=177199 RepID=A0A420Y3Q4_9PEZI|nr:hypothetical protein DL546_001292 [Coniochaeta pulveracea]
MIEAHEDFCRKMARRTGQKFCVIRGSVHVYLGMHEDDLRLQGHIFVRTNEQGHQVDIEHPWQLRHVPEDKEPRTLELYGVCGSLGYMYDVKPSVRKSFNRLKSRADEEQFDSQLEYVPVSDGSLMVSLTPPEDLNP